MMQIISARWSRWKRPFRFCATYGPIQISSNGQVSVTSPWVICIKPSTTWGWMTPCYSLQCHNTTHWTCCLRVSLSEIQRENGMSRSLSSQSYINMTILILCVEYDKVLWKRRCVLVFYSVPVLGYKSALESWIFSGYHSRGFSVVGRR
jgi:hypothetical protein